MKDLGQMTMTHQLVSCFLLFLEKYNDTTEIEETETMQLKIIRLKIFFDNVQNARINDAKNAFYIIRVMLNRIKKKLLKKIASEILQKSTLINFDIASEQYHLFILDVLDTKLYTSNKPTKKPAQKHVVLLNLTINVLKQSDFPKF